MCALHADPLGQLADLAVAQQELLLQISALELLARLAQRQRQEVLLDQRLIDRHFDRELALDLLEPNFLTRAEYQYSLHQVLELTEIAGPGVIAQAVLRSDAK